MLTFYRQLNYCQYASKYGKAIDLLLTINGGPQGAGCGVLFDSLNDLTLEPCQACQETLEFRPGRSADHFILKGAGPHWSIGPGLIRIQKWSVQPNPTPAALPFPSPIASSASSSSFLGVGVTIAHCTVLYCTVLYVLGHNFVYTSNQ